MAIAIPGQSTEPATVQVAEFRKSIKRLLSANRPILLERNRCLIAVVLPVEMNWWDPPKERRRAARGLKRGFLSARAAIVK